MACHYYVYQGVFRKMDVLHLFHAGGFMMYPLLICSIIVVTIFIERFRFYHANKSNIEKLTKEIPNYLEANDVEGLKAALKADGGIPAGILLAGAEQLSRKANQTAILEGAASHAAGVLKSYLNYLDVIVTLSPLMGLLGTVIGMIGSFNVLSVAEGQPFAITGGVAEALVCTASGLFVAIIALIAYTYLSQQVSNFVSQMEKLGSLYLAIVEADQK